MHRSHAEPGHVGPDRMEGIFQVGACLRGTQAGDCGFAGILTSLV